MRLSGGLALYAQHAVDRLDLVGGFAGACILADGGLDGGDRLAAGPGGQQEPALSSIGSEVVTDMHRLAWLSATEGSPSA